MLIPNAIPAIPSNLTLDFKQQRRDTLLSPKTTSQEEKGNEPPEILTGVASVLFTMEMQHVRPSHQKRPLCRDDVPDMCYGYRTWLYSFWGITK